VLAAAGEATAGVCRFCARAYLERRAALEAKMRAALPAGVWRSAEPGARTPADVVVDLRSGLRLSQAQLAGRLGTTQTVVSWWETGKHRPSRMSWTAMRGLAAAGRDRCARVLREIDAMKEACDD
jgi:DNA-binding transcriptional regulator YiaG